MALSLLPDSLYEEARLKLTSMVENRITWLDVGVFSSSTETTDGSETASDMEIADDEREFRSRKIVYTPRRDGAAPIESDVNDPQSHATLLALLDTEGQSIVPLRPHYKLTGKFQI